jgi:3-oxoacyl-[acyl-carrier protein] reductase
VTGEPLAPAAIVTGGSRGIGSGIARMLARRGWNLTISARGEDALREVAAELTAQGGSVHVVAGDVGEESFAETLVSEHMAAWGRLDAVVLAAGVGSAAPIAGYPARRLARQVDVNFRAPFMLVAQAIPHLRRTPESGEVSRVIAISSLEALHPEPGLAAYGAAKAALSSLMSSINAEERHNGVVGTAIAPGYVDTEMSDWVADRIPKSTMLEVNDVVRCVELLLDLSPNALVPQIALHRRDAGLYDA